MAVTLREIAQYTGLSKPTVTRILGRDAHLFSADTRRKVLDAARHLGYRANAAAKSMTSGRFGCAALVLGSDIGRSDLPVGLMLGMQDELTRRDMHLAVTRLPDASLTSDGFVPKVLRESMADGMLINYTHDIPARMLELIRSHPSPVIWINTKLDTDCVHPDDLGGARALTEHLIGLGHRHIAYAKYDSASHYSTAERREGYANAMVDAGLVPQVVSEHVPLDRQVEVTRAILSRHPRPTAVIVRPEDAATFMLVATQLGLSVPQDLSIASISGRLVEIAGRRLLTAEVPTRGVGEAAVVALCRKMADPDRLLPAHSVPFALVTGDSACAIRAE